MPITPSLAMLPDSPDARLLAELSSYSDDLSEAADAMDLALDAGTESPLWPPLTSHAVVAYMRAFAHSNVRQGLQAHLDIPRDLVAVHEMIRDYRNTTVAHSQSRLSMSLPLALLSAQGGVERVVPFNIRHNLPAATASQIADTIAQVAALLGERIRSLADRLTRQYSAANAATVASWPTPRVDHRPAQDFSARSRRSSTPQFTAYWDHEYMAGESSTGHAL